MKRFSAVLGLTGPASVTVRVDTPVDLLAAYNERRAAGVPPLFRITPAVAPAPFRLVHRAQPGAVQVRVGRGGRHMTVNCPVEKLGGGEPLLAPVAVLLERRLNLAGYASMVGACVALPEGAALLLGAEGAGKTSMVIALCRHWDGRLVASDFCVAGMNSDGPVAVAGSKTIFVRRMALRRNHPEVADALDAWHFGRPDDLWWHKQPMSAESLGIKAADQPVPILGAYLLHVDDRVEPTFGPAEAGVAHNSLYENTSRVIRGCSVAFLSGDGQEIVGYVPSLDSPACHRRRVRLIRAFSDDIGLTRAAGPASRIAEWIAEDVRRRAAC